MRKLFLKITIRFILLIAITGKSFSQSIPDSIATKIDSLFKKWNNSTTPGFAVGVIRNDSLIFAKGYGLANLEYTIPIKPETIFHMASISKQFTAYSIILLARQGKLSIDDDIRKYLKWFPDLKQKITIRNLLNHTSGIRDQWQLLTISGTRMDDVITQDHIIKILGKQQALNFNPGDEYNYSNSGFTLLAEIVKSVSGQTLRRFTDSAIFKPLGMDHTHFHDDYTEIEKNRAYSYELVDSTHFLNSILSYSVSGATSLFTNIPDLSKWVMNFYDHKAGDQDDINQLTHKAKLNDGMELDYAAGIAVDIYKGQKRFSHGGADAGYRSMIKVFPDLKMGVLVFSNFDRSNVGGKADQVADLFIKDIATKKPRPPKDSSIAILKNTQSIEKFTGDYISDDGVQFTFRLNQNKFYWLPYKDTLLLVKGLKDSFIVFTEKDVKFLFKQLGPKQLIVEESWPGGKRMLTKFKSDTVFTDQQLQEYAGMYYCAELDCKYGIVLKEHKLWLTNNKYNDAIITPIGDDHLTDDYWFMSDLKATRNEANKITGFEVNAGRVEHLYFKKIE